MKNIHVDSFGAKWVRVFVAALGATLMLVAGPTQAQYTASYQTNTINGVASNWVGTYYVGNNMVFDQLRSVNSGVLTVSSDMQIGYNGGDDNSMVVTNNARVSDVSSYIGYHNSSDGNSALVTGSGSVWTNSGNITVGYNGSRNSMTIADGAKVYNVYSWLGYNGSSSNNSVLVTGTGSVWNTQYTLAIANVGSGSSLTISNGGIVYNTVGWMGNYGRALVTGSGSVWSNRSDLHVGHDPSGNLLTISSGGVVYNADGTIGHSLSSSNNSVLVTGNGSVWYNAGTLTVGNLGRNNSLSISNGGSVLAQNTYLGNTLTSLGNQIAIAGGTLVVTNGLRTGQLNLFRGGLSLNSGTITADNLLITNGTASVMSFNGGTLNTRRTTVNNGSVFTVGNGSSAATLHLQGGTHSFATGLTINTNALLNGTGAIFANLTLAGKLAPGDSPGVITNFGNLTLQTSAVLDMQLGGTMQRTEYDFILVTNGTVTLNGLLQVSFINGFASTVSSNDTFVLLQGNSPLGGSFTNVIGGYVITAGGEGTFYVDYGNNAVTLSGYQVVVPEPSTLALCAVALVSLLAARRRRSSRRP